MSEASEGSSESVKLVISNEDGLSTVLSISVLEALSLHEGSADAVLTIPVVVTSLRSCERSHLLAGGGSCLTTITGDILSVDLATFCCLCLDDVEESFGFIGV